MSNKCVLCYWFLDNKIRSDERERERERWTTKPLIVGLRKSKKKKNKLVLPNTKKKSSDRNEG